MTKWLAVLISLTSLGLTEQQRQADESRPVTVDCNAGGAINRVLKSLKPGDVVLVQGRCLENVVIQSELQRITIDGQGTATVKPPDARQPAIQVLGREIRIKGFTTDGGFSGIAINRGGTAIVDHNMIENASEMGLEVSQNSFGRIINNTIRHSGVDGILVLGSASAHIGVLRTDDTVPSPNSILENGGDGIRVLRTSTARIIGNSLTGNRRSGLSVQQASHADVAGNRFDGNAEHGIRAVGNSAVNLADSAMGLFTQPNTTTVPNGLFGIRCESGAHVDGPIGSLVGKNGAKDVSDITCIDRSTR
ncbi:nitrous oxide reductase family maturation protein NosD [Luteitalea pratensis]|uniref:Nitrous oxide reductase family maturation protein NosD n=1 Tax=Luteitalea pratensis TaxID=1855912 RepID=A0A143PI86_LUTPR|nr:right-handed parallel beta-helix repeat-containing protein [Luteitalea pratensis]AMY07973.1 nitrous oxide reductase family maturation protein NosD [Luteitalea pratensis]